jgi:hypothetical protein
MKYCTNSYFFDSISALKIATPLHELAHHTSQQAVIERGSDAKTVERRGEVF